METTPPPPVATPPTPLSPPPRRTGPIRAAFRFAWKSHLLLALAPVFLTSLVVSEQVEGRADFANTELAQGVEDRWGEPVRQPAPSLRAVESGSVFTELKPMPFDSQHVRVDAAMNYRKRGLRYFSGFDFTFRADYAYANRSGHDEDVAFIFPIEFNKSQVLLSDVELTVNGKPAQVELKENGTCLLWTGRVKGAEQVAFTLGYKARGLGSFIYRLDPSLAARDIAVHLSVTGGDNFDFPEGTLSAQQITQTDDALAFDWRYSALESGVSLGLILPSEKSYDAIIATMARRAWAPFLSFFALWFVLSLGSRRRLMFYEVGLLSATYAFFFVLVAYLSAFIHFYVAWPLCLVVMGAAAVLYLKKLFPEAKSGLLALGWLWSMGVPTLAVVIPGYTGLIYTLELLAALIVALHLSLKPNVRALLNPELQGAL
ncbi:MAG: putative rane protein [Myxococcaceae bacterium]|nr:putative rane protein [Myxococcaceae bacterium]